jgi:hypothetical protein
MKNRIFKLVTFSDEPTLVHCDESRFDDFESKSLKSFTPTTVMMIAVPKKRIAAQQ